MGFPHYQARSTPVTGTGDITCPWPDHRVDDVALLIVETSNAVATLGTANGFVAVATSQGTGGGGTNSVYMHVFWCRATSEAMAAPVVADPGDHATAAVLTFSNCVATGNPYSSYANTTGSGTSGSIPGGTTPEDECLIVQIIGSAFDSDTGEAFSAFTNADLRRITEVIDVRRSTANGGGFGVAVGEKDVAGAFGATTVTILSSDTFSGLSIILLPAEEDPGDITPPLIDGFTVTPNSQVTADTVIGFDVTDESWLAAAVILASFPNGTVDVVHDGDSFRGRYTSTENTRSAITDGYRYTVLRRGGWPGNPTLEFIVVDTGNLGTLAEEQ